MEAFSLLPDEANPCDAKPTPKIIAEKIKA